MSSLRRRTASVDVVDAKVAVDLATAQTYSENVFLFVPNLIGVFNNHLHFFPENLTSLFGRLHTRHPRCRFTPFHELSSKILHDHV